VIKDGAGQLAKSAVFHFGQDKSRVNKADETREMLKQGGVYLVSAPVKPIDSQNLKWSALNLTHEIDLQHPSTKVFYLYYIG
jgi:hypothetical protein